MSRSLIRVCAACPRRRAITRVEVLLLSLLAVFTMAILIPAVSAVGERSRGSVCLGNLRALGVAIWEYTECTGDVLPGPVHPAIYHDIDEQTTPWRRQRTLIGLLRDVVGETITDRLITCPVMSRVNPDQSFIDYRTLTGRMVEPVHYVLNNVGLNDWVGGAIGNLRTTNPPQYFGFASYSPVEPMTMALERRYRPRRFGEVANPDREWMIADAWFRPRANPAFPGLQQEGSYQWSWAGEAMPNFAPHRVYGLRTYSFASRNWRCMDSALIRHRKSDGITNTLYFDGHAGGVPARSLTLAGFELLYGFPGTVNPLDPVPPGSSWR